MKLSQVLEEKQDAQGKGQQAAQACHQDNDHHACHLQVMPCFLQDINDHETQEREDAGNNHLGYDKEKNGTEDHQEIVQRDITVDLFREDPDKDILNEFHAPPLYSIIYFHLLKSNIFIAKVCSDRSLRAVVYIAFPIISASKSMPLRIDLDGGSAVLNKFDIRFKFNI